jgi:hypothetical protein
MTKNTPTTPSTRDEIRRAIGAPPVDQIIAFEMGELNQAECIDLFQELINSGLAWQLQGTYGRTARSLIESGECTPAVNQ